MHNATKIICDCQLEEWRMVNSKLCETARLAFFSARPRLFEFLNKMIARLNWDFETALQKSRLRNIQNRSKNETARPVKFD